MINRFCYIPILKGRDGEYRGLARLRRTVGAQIRPLLEVPCIKRNVDTRLPMKTIDEHIAPIPRILKNVWGPERPFIVDAPYVTDEDRLADGRHAIGMLFDSMKILSLQGIPSTALDRTPAYQTAVKEVVRRDQRGIAVRIRPDQFIDARNAWVELQRLINTMTVAANEVDLIIDGRDLEETQVKGLASHAAKLARRAADSGFRSVVIAATGFPCEVGAIVKAGAAVSVRRTELDFFAEVHAKAETQLVFGDYCIVHPEPLEWHKRLNPPAANLRYTAGTSWAISRAKYAKRGAEARFRELCQRVVANDIFAGAGFSDGDCQIEQCARGESIGAGTSRKWIELGTSHHITTVVEQDASRLGFARK